MTSFSQTSTNTSDDAVEGDVSALNGSHRNIIGVSFYEEECEEMEDRGISRITYDEGEEEKGTDEDVSNELEEDIERNPNEMMEGGISNVNLPYTGDEEIVIEFNENNEGLLPDVRFSIIPSSRTTSSDDVPTTEVIPTIGGRGVPEGREWSPGNYSTVSKKMREMKDEKCAKSTTMCFSFNNATMIPSPTPLRWDFHVDDDNSLLSRGRDVRSFGTQTETFPIENNEKLGKVKKRLSWKASGDGKVELVREESEAKVSNEVGTHACVCCGVQ